MEELFFIQKQPKQSQHCRVHPGNDLYVARQDRLAFCASCYFFKCVAGKKKKKKRRKEQFCLPS